MEKLDLQIWWRFSRTDFMWLFDLLKSVVFIVVICVGVYGGDYGSGVVDGGGGYYGDCGGCSAGSSDIGGDCGAKII